MLPGAPEKGSGWRPVEAGAEEGLAKEEAAVTAAVEIIGRPHLAATIAARHTDDLC
jgi:hypothetical protein